ncbi:IS701 family transposase [Streptomyces sp. NPDC086766]|uniref:IS701 family transposase n=1 Tax=Streptomyces sp. NPDC086766 TaxID=3365754 RepID=UPI00380B96E7
MLTSRSLGPRASSFDFAEQVFGHLPRADQRRWAHAYLMALLRTPGKKSVRRLAQSLSDSATAAQSLHQFVNASPWPWEPVCRKLMRWAEQCTVPRAWTVDVAVLRKRGEHSCGVHRRFIPGTGRSVNCQIGIGAFVVTDHDALPVGWRLLLPRIWIEDSQRRTRTRIPPDAATRSLEGGALDLIRAMGDRTQLAEVPVVADLSTHCGTSTLARGLSLQGRDFVIGVPASLPVVAGRQLRAQQQDGSGWPAVMDAGKLFDPVHSERAGLDVYTSREGQANAPLIQSSIVHLAGRGADPAVQRSYRLLGIRSPRSGRPLNLWLTSMVNRRLDEVVELTQLQARSVQTLERLEQDYGLLDFEGRSYPGWHHHMALMSAAYMHRRLNLPDSWTPQSH